MTRTDAIVHVAIKAVIHSMSFYGQTTDGILNGISDRDHVPFVLRFQWRSLRLFPPFGWLLLPSCGAWLWQANSGYGRECAYKSQGMYICSDIGPV